MKRSLFFIGVCSLSFLTGRVVNYSGKAQVPKPTSQVGSAPPSSSPTPCPQEDQFPKLIDDSYATSFNGARLSLDYSSGVQPVDLPYAVDDAKVTPMHDGGMLVMFGDTLYRFDRQRHVNWRYRTDQIMFDFAYVQFTNLIYGTAGDNVMFILNAANGKVLTGDSRNGSAAYGEVQKYGEDMCLVTDNFVIYRQRGRAAGIEPMKDGITCWRGTKILWHLEFPPDADLVVNGKTILAVTKTRKAIYIKEIKPPMVKSE